MTTGMGRVNEKTAAFLHCVWFVTLLLLVMSNEPVNGFSIGAKIQQSAGCYHNGTIYAERSLIPSVEPCLTCRCQNKSLVCALKVCPEQVSIPPRGCVLVHPKRACCPYLSCKTFRVNGIANEIITRRLDQIGYGHYEVDDHENANSNLQRSDDIDLFEENSVCIEDGSVYGSGSAMVSSNFCSYCYCFAGKRICVNPKCQLPNTSKCRPLYAEGSCCPVHYDCSANSTSVTEKSNSNSLIQGNSVHNRNYLRKTKLPENKGKCYANGVSYFDGQKLPNDKSRPCEMCFCIRGNVMCTPKKCAPYIGNCKPLIPDGECCAVGYECRSKTNETTRHFRQDTGDEFDLFALLFGDDKPSATTTNAPATIDESLMGSNIHNGSSTETTTAQILREKGFFELLRDGLSMLDNSEEEQNKTDIEQQELFSSTILEERPTTEYPSTNIVEEMQRIELFTPSTNKPSSPSTTTEVISSTIKVQEKTTVKPSTFVTSSLKPSAPSSTVRTSIKPSPTTTRTTKEPSSPMTTESNDIIETTTDTSTIQPQNDQTEIIGTEIHINTVTNVPNLQHSSISTKSSTSTTTTPISTTSSIIPFKPLNYGNSSNFLSAFLNMFDLGKTSGTKAPFKPTIAPVTNDVKINPLIVEPQYNFDYDAPTLPPSLPNLRIIPFVPDDAVELRTEDLAKYPSITEKTSIDRYDDLDKVHGQDLEQKKHEYNFDYEHIGEIPVQAGWGDYYTNYRPLNYDQKPVRNGIDRFSPPMQTEGGFIPKEPSRTKPGFIESLYITTEEPIKGQTTYKEITEDQLLLANYNTFDQSMISITTSAPATTTKLPVPNVTARIEPTIRIETVPIFKGIPATLQQLSIQPSLDPATVQNENRRKSEAMADHILNEIGVIRVGPAPTERVPDTTEKETVSTVKSLIIEKIKPVSELGLESREASPEILTKPSKFNDINNLLRLSGCNIYGQMYNVGEFIEELSDNCTMCMCTNSGVQCSDSECK